MPRCIICERSERWAAALRTPLARNGHRLVETRSLDDCWQEVAGRPRSLVALEATPANLESLLPWMRRLAAAFPHVRVIGLGCPALGAGQWVLREAGAVHVVHSPRQWLLLVRIADRHLGSAPGAEESDRQRIWRRLPWGDNADVI